MEEGAPNSERLFLASCIRVSQSDKDRLREELRDVISRFLEKSDDDNGDTVVTVSCSFL
jgi:hypothetical protein